MFRKDDERPAIPERGSDAAASGSGDAASSGRLLTSNG